MHTRRHLIGLAAGASAAALLAGCSATPSVGVPAFVSMLEAVLAEVPSIIPQLQSLGLSSVIVAQITPIIQSIEGLLQGINNATTAASGQAIVVQIETYINTLAPLVEPFLALIPGVGTILGLIIAALPAIEAVVNIVVTYLSPTAITIAQNNAPAIPSVPSTSARLKGLAPPPFGTNAQAYLLMLESRAKASGRLRRR